MKKKVSLGGKNLKIYLSQFLISRQLHCSSIAAEKNEMWRNKFGKLLIAFLICRHYNCSPWWMEKLRLGGTKVRELLIAFSISRQRKKCHLKISHLVLLTQKIGHLVLFL